MKVTQEKIFSPVTITLESQAEVNAIWTICQRIGGHSELGARLMVSRLSADLSAKTLFKVDGDPIDSDSGSIYFSGNSDEILGFEE